MALRLRKSGMLSMVYRAPPGLSKDINKRNSVNKDLMRGSSTSSHISQGKSVYLHSTYIACPLFSKLNPAAGYFQRCTAVHIPYSKKNFLVKEQPSSVLLTPLVETVTPVQESRLEPADSGKETG